MWSLYILMALLTAALTLKMVHPLLGRGRHRHGDALTQNDRRLVWALIALIPLAALGLYLALGRPDMPGSPRMLTGYQTLEADHASLLAQRPMETLLTKNPDDINALMTMAQINVTLDKPQSALPYLSHALTVAARDPREWRTYMIAVSLVDIQVEANNGVVGADAIQTLDVIDAMKNGSPIVRYYRALYKAQNGDVETAIREWTVLLNDGQGDTYWKKRLRAKLAEVLAQQSQARAAERQKP